jgi:hypothetical protein
MFLLVENNDQFYDTNFTSFLKNLLSEIKADVRLFDCDKNLNDHASILNSVKERFVDAILDKLKE